MVIGFMLILGFIVISISIWQFAVVPSQNRAVEFNHFQAVQDDLADTQSSLIDAEYPKPTSAKIQLGQTYPSRTIFVNPGPVSGHLRTATFGNGLYYSSEIDFTKACGTDPTHQTSTKAITYLPTYHYLEGHADQIYENTLLYQPTDDIRYDSAVNRSSQFFIDPNERTISLFPLQGNVDIASSSTTTVQFFGPPNGTGGIEVTPPFDLTIPSRLNDTYWSGLVSHGDVSFSNNGSDELVDVAFSGSNWTVLCTPVGINRVPDQPHEPKTPPDQREEEEEDESEQEDPDINPASPNDVQVQLEDTDVGGGNPKTVITKVEKLNPGWANITHARIAFYDSSESSGHMPDWGDVTFDGTTTRLHVGENYTKLNSAINITNTTTQVDFEFDDTGSPGGDWFVWQVIFENNQRATYFIFIKK